MPDFITIGESMVYLSPDQPGSLKYIDRFKKGLAGAEGNVAMGLAKIGASVGWASRVGKDPFGQFVISGLRGEGVDTSQVTLCDKYPTGLLVKELTPSGSTNVYYYRKGSAANYLDFDEIDKEYIKSAKVVLFTGISLALSQQNRDFARKLFKFCNENGVLVAFDPNIRLKLWNKEEAREEILDILQYVDIFMPGIEEAEMLFGESDPKQIVNICIEKGINTVVLKSGEADTVVATKYEYYEVPIFKVSKVVDTVGAGDAFVAGFLKNLIDGNKLDECAKIGNAMGAMAVQAFGDMEGLPTLEELNNFLQGKKSVDR